MEPGPGLDRRSTGHRTLACGAMLALLVLSQSLPARSAEGGSSAPSRDRIVFAAPITRGEAVESELFTIGVDGSGLQNLLARAFSQRQPAWSPDGREIAFSNRGSIHVMSSQGDRERAVLSWVQDAGNDSYELLGWPSWSPDGTRLAYVRYRYSRVDGSVSSVVATVRLNGRGERVLHRSENPLHQPVWSPSGRQIAFFMCDDTRELARLNHCSAFTMAADGSDVRDLGTTTSLWNGYPRWVSEDRLTLVSNRGCLEDPDLTQVNSCWGLFTVAPDGSAAEPLLGPEDWDEDGELDGYWVAEPSPQGPRFLLSVILATGDTEFWVWEPRSDRRRKIFDGPVWGEADWQPRCTVRGTRADDVLRGTSGRDLICGLGGDDTIHGLGGDDVIFGHAGDDVIVGGKGRDIVVGNAGRDRCDRDERDHSRVC